ncbi:hypothetical protein CUPS4244_08540 [Campylobacter upsaliensis]|uniref:hypothetical protein n=1 Tax=Campylobacter upsaliensis TaxID=28080 RepID=UPI00214A6156|nr:hypothetical protein [Campylobacter upsaliensis]MCR2105120.1 hypothetical protein [Campylobacter upsaliensis]
MIEQEDYDYKTAYLNVVEEADAWIYPFNMNWALSFVKEYCLGIYENFFSSGIYIKEALCEYKEQVGYDDLEVKERESFKEWLKGEGLLFVIGEKVLNEANELLSLKDIELDLKEKIKLENDAIELFIKDKEEARELLEDLAKKIKLKNLENQIEKKSFTKSFFQGFYAFKCLMQLTKEQ